MLERPKGPRCAWNGQEDPKVMMEGDREKEGLGLHRRFCC